MMSTTYVNFTPAERKQARTTDLAEFLRRQGYDLRREGRGSVWMNGGEKDSIQGNLWVEGLSLLAKKLAPVIRDFYLNE